MSRPAGRPEAQGGRAGDGRQHSVVHRDPFAYCSHPGVLRLSTGEWLIAFMETMRRAEVLHSPSDPRFYNVLTRSGDQGLTWSAPVVAPGFDWYGVECPSLTQIPGGDLLLFQWRWRWQPWAPGRDRPSPPALYERANYPWARGNDGAYVHRSRDLGYTWQTGRRIDTAPFAGAYTIRSAVALPDGSLLYAVTDTPRWRQIYLLRSRDGGATWSVGARVAASPDRQFSEPCLVQAGGRLLVLAREEVTGFLHQAESEDEGETWTAPRATPMWGCPPHVLPVGDDRLLCVYGRRRPPYSIRGCVSADGGRSWDIAEEIIVRGDLRNANLGYPSSVLAARGRVFTVYYAEDGEGITCIQGTQYTV